MIRVAEVTRSLPRQAPRLNIWVIVTALFAISLQVLTTIEIGGASLRVSSSDIALPVLGLMLFAKWVKDGTPWPEWRIPYFWTWLFVLTGWMVVALVSGRLQTGVWQSWALVNKGIGWLILLGYLLLGGWIATLLEIRIRDLLLRSFIVFGWAVFACVLLLYSLAVHNLIPEVGATYYPRPAGLFANPNAFGIAAAAMASLQAAYLTRRPLFTPKLALIGLGLTCAAIVLSVSRSAWLGLFVAAIGLLAMGGLHWRDVVRVAASCTVIVLAVLHGPGLTVELAVAARQALLPTIGSNASPVQRSRTYLNTALDQGRNPGIKERLASARAAFQAWKTAPIVGIGLGTYYDLHKDTPNVADTIHNTFLWLLTEAGLIGVGLFSAFFLIVFVSLVRCARAPPKTDPFLIGVLGVLLAFAGASIGTEILYQRYLWFFLGLALASPRSHTALCAPACAGTSQSSKDQDARLRVEVR